MQMQMRLGMATLVCIGLASPVAAQQNCNAIIPPGGGWKLESQRGKEQLETAKFRHLKESKVDKQHADGSYTGWGYGEGSADRHQASALKRTSFDWLTRYSESEVLLASGDPVFVNAWVTCMGQTRARGVAWFEAIDSTHVYLKMKIARISEEKDAVAIPVRSIKVTTPPELTIDGAPCAAITVGECVVAFNAVPPQETIAALVRTTVGTLDARWVLVPGSAQVAVAQSGAATTCRVAPAIATSKNPYQFHDAPNVLKFTLTGRTQSSTLHGSCRATVSYEMMQFAQVPITATLPTQ